MEWYGWLVLGVIAVILVAGGYSWLTVEKTHKPIIHYGGWRGGVWRGFFRPFFFGDDEDDHWMECPNCGGEGRWGIWDICRRCGGSGKIVR